MNLCGFSSSKNLESPMMGVCPCQEIPRSLGDSGSCTGDSPSHGTVFLGRAGTDVISWPREVHRKWGMNGFMLKHGVPKVLLVVVHVPLCSWFYRIYRCKML